MNKIFLLIFFCICTVLCSCTQNSNDTTVDTEQKNINEQIAELHETLDTYKLPVQMYPVPIESSANTIETVNRLESAINRYLTDDGNILGDFGFGQGWHTEIALIAVKNTPHISDIESITENHPNHIISQLIINESMENNVIQEMYYIDDIIDSVSTLFGEDIGDIAGYNLREELYTSDNMSYICYPREGIYLTKYTIGYSTATSKVLTYTKGGNEYLCDVVLIPSFGILLDIDNGLRVQITDENFSEYLDYLPRYLYTLTENGDQFILKSIRTVSLPQ